MKDKTIDQHTPGPWTVSNEESPLDFQMEVRVTSGEAQICYFIESNNEAIANARLIAAAPDLLDALQELIYIAGVLAQTCLGDEGQKENCLDRAIAAVEKATGKRWKT